MVPFNPENPSEEVQMIHKFAKKNMGGYLDEIKQSENTDEFHTILTEVADIFHYYATEWKDMDVTKNKDISKVVNAVNNTMKTLDKMTLKQPEYDAKKHGDGFKLY
ncbi:hypothetical protein AKJ59_00265 [candidate division MSBL1 archaeon SCGC-AAA385M02]|uniref:Uncharacterized protein n=1 Tax=candidate division MSBL1 archaeon SCGC-AAA385M02 TaxID=1698287 RepID=A0A133VR83_9EURY|nr:hypothetical protein AKJ59_00265 [candidate division MSBL1 archaeon SCGC-AAA385M02]